MKAIEKTTAREFRLVLSPLPGNRLPKKARSVTGKVDGEKVTIPVTTNRGWAASPETILEYLWIVKDGKAYYLTLDYAESARDGFVLKIEEGVAARVDPARIGDVKRETERLAKFAATIAAAKAPTA